MTRSLLIAIFVAVAFAAIGDTQKAPEIERIPQFENASVTAWKTVLPPGAKSTYHRHDHGRTVVGIVGGDLKTVTRDGRTRVTHYEAGKAYWFGPDAAGETHIDLNDTSKPIEVIVVELK